MNELDGAIGSNVDHTHRPHPPHDAVDDWAQFVGELDEGGAF